MNRENYMFNFNEKGNIRKIDYHLKKKKEEERRNYKS